MEYNQLIEVNDKMQTGYSYLLSVGVGEEFPSDFKPFYTPAEMLGMGIFEGKYCNDCKSEFPETWFEHAKISDTPNININYFFLTFFILYLFILGFFNFNQLRNGGLSGT